MAAACRYALTGVGAAIASGNQACSGTWAHLASAPTRTSSTASWTSPPSGGCASRDEIRSVPASWRSSTRPSSITKPAPVVTSRARRAARRLARARPPSPISRNEHSVVSSHATYRPSSESTRTRASIAPAKTTSRPAVRPSPSVRSRRYAAAYSRTSTPTTVTTRPRTRDSTSRRRGTTRPRVGAHSHEELGVAPPTTAGTWDVSQTAAVAGASAPTRRTRLPRRGASTTTAPATSRWAASSQVMTDGLAGRASSPRWAGS